MTGRIPTWLADWLGVPLPTDADAATWQLDSAWRWAPWATVLLVLAAIAWTATLYARESTSAGRGYRALLASLRLCAIGLVLIMLAQWALGLRLTGPATIALVIDRSASMAIVDNYADEDLAATLARRLATNELNGATRLNLAKLILSENDGRVLKQLSHRYRVAVYFAADGVERNANAAELPDVLRDVRALSADGPKSQATRLGDAVYHVLDDFRGRPPAAIVLLSDGVSTAGVPLASAAEDARRRGVPLVAVGLGSDHPPRDVELADVLVDNVVFVNDLVSVHVQVKATGLEGEPAKITLRREDKINASDATESASTGSTGASKPDSAGSTSASTVVAEQTIVLPPTGQTISTHLVDRPTTPGDFEYVVEIAPVLEETNLDNNRQQRTISVRDEKIRVLLIHGYPSYEFRFLKTLLERDRTVELATYLQDADPEFAEQDKTALRSLPVGREELFEYYVLLIGDVDPRLLPRSVWQNVRAFAGEKGGGVAFIAGPRSLPWLYRDNPDVSALLPVEVDDIGFAPDDTLPSEVSRGFVVQPTPLGLQSPAFQLGDKPAATEEVWRNLAPLYWLVDVGKVKPGAQVLAVGPADGPGSHALRGNEQNTPIIVFQYVGPGRVLFHAIDSTWRWRSGAGDVYFARYWVQTIRFLARGKLSSGRGAQLATDRREYQHGEPVALRARFLDPRLSPAGDEVAVLVNAAAQPRRRMTLHRNPAVDGVFEGTLADLGVGQYEVLLAEPQLPESPPATRFRVVARPGELARTEMDAAALSSAAEATRGTFYTIADADQLLEKLPEGRRVPLENLPPVPLWNQWWLVAAFLVCITNEWILRKRKGML